MFRITKSTPGVLDLSAVKDEHGIPVTLIGPSHRDVPDHEESNPVLQRIVELRWVSVSKVPVETLDEPALEPSPPVPVPYAPLRDPVTTAELEPAATTESTSANSNSDAENNDHTMTSVADVAPSPAVKLERKPSRRT